MLTKNDLQQIGDLIDTKTRQIVQEELTPIKKDVKSLKRDAGKLKRDMKVVVSFFDRETIGLAKRVDRIEHHLGI